MTDVPPVLTVTRLLAGARVALERGLGVVWVGGEISNLYRAASGHCYFTLKDASAQVRCTLYRMKAQHVDFELADGQAVELRALASIYEQRGEFQLNVDAIRRAGVGALYERFLALKRRLEQAGWLADERKRPLPAMPRVVGIITSPRGAAVRDVLTTLARRWPRIRVIIYPTAVQGTGSAADIVRALATANRHGLADVLILCRGGGSLEDLWSFNEEAVARAIVESRLPIVCGVGHETDVTIADLVADCRAATPTAAATLVVPDVWEARERARHDARRLCRAAAYAIGQARQRLDLAEQRLVHPSERLAAQRERLCSLAGRLRTAGGRALRQDQVMLHTLRQRLLREMRIPPDRKRGLAQARVMLARAGRRHLDVHAALYARLAASLSHLNPDAVLSRGYAIVSTAAGAIVTDASSLAPGDAIEVRVARGGASARVERVDPETSRG